MVKVEEDDEDTRRRHDGDTRGVDFDDVVDHAVFDDVFSEE